MSREEWLASLQTFDRVWVPSGRTGRGRITRVIRLGDGRIVEDGVHLDCAWDMRHPFMDGTCIEPVPEAPWGHCPKCGKPSGQHDHLKGGTCRDCRHVPRACPAGCRTREEHEAEVRAQRQRCGLAPNDVTPVH